MIGVTAPATTEYFVTKGTAKEDIGLPAELTITIQTPATEAGGEAATREETVSVTWEGIYDPVVLGDYTLTAALADPAYQYDGEMPTIIVRVYSSPSEQEDMAPVLPGENTAGVGGGVAINGATTTITISKQTAGTQTPDADTLFTFTVKDAQDVAAVGIYTIDGVSTDIPENGIITLKAGQFAVLSGLPVGRYTITETEPGQAVYQGTDVIVNGTVYENIASATVYVEETAGAGTSGGWHVDQNDCWVYTVTADQIDANKEIKIDFDRPAQAMEYKMRKNYSSKIITFPIKIVNESGIEITYKDYSFTTQNRIGSGEIFSPSTEPVMNNKHSSGWGMAWQVMLPIIEESTSISPVFEAEDFEGNGIRLAIAPLRAINPAIISYFRSNPGRGELTGASGEDIKALNVTLLQMNAFDSLIKGAFTFKNYLGQEVPVAEDASRTYADFLCIFYDVTSLDELSGAQKYNTLGFGSLGSPEVPYGGQTQITTYYSKSVSEQNLCVPHKALDNGTLNHFQNWGFSYNEIVGSNEYAYQPSYYLLESDPKVLQMGYEYLYERCIRFSFDNLDREIFTGNDNMMQIVEDVSSVKSYIDRTDDAVSNAANAFKSGTWLGTGDSISLENIGGFIETPNAWNQYRQYDFGFDVTFEAKDLPEKPSSGASVVFCNRYGEELVQTGTLTVSKAVAGMGSSTDKMFTFRFTFSEAGTYSYTGSRTGTLTTGGSVQLKHGESITITIPQGVMYTVVEDAVSHYAPTPSDRTYSGTIGGTPATAAYTNRYEEPYEPPIGYLTGNLTVKKTITGDQGDMSQDFIFTITFSAGGSYAYTGSYDGMIRSGGTVFLKHGEYITIHNLPAGTTYSVIESGNSGYYVHASDDTGMIAANTTATAAFTNTKVEVPKTGDGGSLIEGLLLITASLIGAMGMFIHDMSIKRGSVRKLR